MTRFPRPAAFGPQTAGPARHSIGRERTATSRQRLPAAQSIGFTDPVLRYRVWQCVDDARTFLCIHGLGGSNLHWAPVAESLLKHGRVVSVDLPGFGGSGPNDGITSIEAMSRGVDLALNLLCAGRVVLVGHDLGCIVAVAEAARSMRIEALVMTAPPLRLGDDSDELVAAVFGSADHLVELAGMTFSDPAHRAWYGERFAREILQRGLASGRPVPAWLVAAVSQEARETREGHVAAATASAGMNLVHHLARPDWLLHTARRVTCPVLVIHGTADEQMPVQWSRDFCLERRDWTLVELAGAGHHAHIDHPEEWAGAVSMWLTSAAGARPRRRPAATPSGQGSASRNHLDRPPPSRGRVPTRSSE